jgi:adenylate cyclase
MIRTLMETYLGRDAGQRVLSGRIVRGIAEQIDAVVWFSDLQGFTRITDTAPEEVMSLLNDYSDVIISAIDEHGGDVLKLIGGGILAIFRAEDRLHACNVALSAAIAARDGVVELNKHRAAKQAVDRHASGFAHRECLLWQCRQPRAARLYRPWTGRERGKPHSRDVPFG